jgi:ABC-type Fe3+-citrate transport system substrate-binding protein
MKKRNKLESLVFFLFLCVLVSGCATCSIEEEDKTTYKVKIKENESEVKIKGTEAEVIHSF